MSPSDTAAALERAGRRALYHLLRAAIEGLKAVEAVIDELGSVGKATPPGDDLERIDVE